MSRARPVVAIDGPAGAGKSTVTQRVAAALGYFVVDTGALYRTVALVAERAGIDFEDAERVGELAEALVARDAVKLEGDPRGGSRVILDGADVSGAIRTQSLSQGASKVSAQPRVRAALLELQRSAGRAGGVVLEGRDIGTVVFPDAEAKIFLTASVDERAKRRFEQLVAAGTPADIDSVRREVVERDQRDSTRPIAPLRKAPDALVVDSSELSIDQVVARIVAHVRGVAAKLGPA
ncbi:MAG TPA: (d)CMP kinase [Polyangiaceae bacterium]|nr:(d)CMP kinase [Polyangiaceae bacterium]